MALWLVWLYGFMAFGFRLVLTTTALEPVQVAPGTPTAGHRHVEPHSLQLVEPGEP